MADARLLFGRPRDMPIFLGGFGERGVRLAGRIADGVRAAAQWDPSYALQLRKWLEDSAQAAGRDPEQVELVLENWTCLHPDRDLARQKAQQLLAPFLPHLGPLVRFYGDDALDRFMAAGDAGDLRRGLDRLADAGFTNVSFSGVLGPDPALALTMLGDELAQRQ